MQQCLVIRGCGTLSHVLTCVPDPLSWVYFYLIVNCCWVHLILWLGGFNEIQLVMSNSGYMVTCCFMIRSSVFSVSGNLLGVVFWMMYNFPFMAWFYSRGPGLYVKIPLALEQQLSKHPQGIFYKHFFHTKRWIYVVRFFVRWVKHGSGILYLHIGWPF